MSKLLFYFAKLDIGDLISFIYTILSLIPGLFLRLVVRDIWIISERKDEAKDNGYCFFKYICLNAKKENVYYAISKQCKDYDKVKQLGKVIDFGSFKHHVYTWAARKYISSQYSNGMPSRVMFYCWLFGGIRIKFCFLQHGVTKDKSNYLMVPAKKVKFVACVSNRETKFMNSIGYSIHSALTTGFCRYDDLRSSNNKQVFIMFTWRNYLMDLVHEEFRQTEYYKVLSELLSCDVWKNVYSDSKVILLLHPGMKKFRANFKTEFDNVEIADNDKYTFQELISESSLFITDFSSVSFDFAYLGKEICYLQFDTETFREKHLQSGYFDYDKDGFGPVFDNIKDMQTYISEYKFKQEDIYRKRALSFFTYFDRENCKRNYDVIESL